MAHQCHTVLFQSEFKNYNSGELVETLKDSVIYFSLINKPLMREYELSPLTIDHRLSTIDYRLLLLGKNHLNRIFYFEISNAGSS